MLEQESFWSGDCFVVVTDKTKPAMSLTIDELASRGKKVYVVDMSEKPDETAFRKVSEIPSDANCAVVGLTKINPGEIIKPTIRSKIINPTNFPASGSLELKII